MLEVQKFLIENGIDKLVSRYAIKVRKHDVRPFMTLNYHQIDSPKFSKITQECRALVLRSDNFDIVAKSFNRFFNWGELTKRDRKDFNFGNFRAEAKIDGSIILIFHAFNEWFINTRGTFGDHVVHNDFPDIIWRDLVLEAAKNTGVDINSLDKAYTYVCEVVSPYNQDVRYYKEPRLYLLSAFNTVDKNNVTEISWDEHAALALEHGFITPEIHNLYSIDEVINKIEEMADPTFEGFVLHDINHKRFKVKNPGFLILSRMHNNGQTSPKDMVAIVLSDSVSEMVSYFPHMEERLGICSDIMYDTYKALEEVWESAKNIEDQKEFALKIIGETPMAGVLFNLRKAQRGGKPIELEDMWKQSHRLITRTLFGR